MRLSGWAPYGRIVAQHACPPSFLPSLSCEDTLRRQPSLQAKKRPLARNQPCQHLDLGFLGSRLWENKYRLSHQSVVFCYGSLSKLIQYLIVTEVVVFFFLTVWMEMTFVLHLHAEIILFSTDLVNYWRAKQDVCRLCQAPAICSCIFFF